MIRVRQLGHSGQRHPEAVRTFWRAIIWSILRGWLRLGYSLPAALLLCLVTIVGIPFGLKAMRLGAATLTPFVRRSSPTSARGFLPLLPSVNLDLVVRLVSSATVGAGHLDDHHHRIPFAKQTRRSGESPVAFAPPFQPGY